MIAKARGRSEGGGNFSLSLHPSHLPLSSRSSALWGGTRPLIIPFIAHRGPKEGCKRTRKRRPLAPSSPSSTVCPLRPRRLLRPWMPPHQWNNPTSPPARRRRLLNSEISWNVPPLLLLFLLLRSVDWRFPILSFSSRLRIFFDRGADSWFRNYFIFFYNRRHSK